MGYRDGAAHIVTTVDGGAGTLDECHGDDGTDTAANCETAVGFP